MKLLKKFFLIAHFNLLHVTIILAIFGQNINLIFFSFDLNELVRFDFELSLLSGKKKFKFQIHFTFLKSEILLHLKTDRNNFRIYSWLISPHLYG